MNKDIVNQAVKLYLDDVIDGDSLSAIIKKNQNSSPKIKTLEVSKMLVAKAKSKPKKKNKPLFKKGILSELIINTIKDGAKTRREVVNQIAQSMGKGEQTSETRIYSNISSAIFKLQKQNKIKLVFNKDINENQFMIL